MYCSDKTEIWIFILHCHYTQ